MGGKFVVVPRPSKIPGLEFGEDERLFHYTSAAGLIGILDSNCLWATHYRYLNDSKEFTASRLSLIRYFQEVVLVQMARQKVNKGFSLKPDLDKKVVARDLAESLVNLMAKAVWGSEEHNVFGVDGYVFSTFRSSPAEGALFSDGGLLHWATYGRGGGVAIQLNPAKLEEILLEEGNKHKGGLAWMSHPAVYAEEGVRPSELKQQYDEIGEVVHAITEANILGKDWPEGIARPAFKPFMVISCLLKDVYFRDEHEARLVVFRSQDKIPGQEFHDVHLRMSEGAFVPYIKLFDGILLGEKCPIERIIVGPYGDIERRVLAIQTLLRARRIDNIKITTSNVPFVNVR